MRRVQKVCRFLVLVGIFASIPLLSFGCSEPAPVEEHWDPVDPILGCIEYETNLRDICGRNRGDDASIEEFCETFAVYGGPQCSDEFAHYYGCCISELARQGCKWDPPTGCDPLATDVDSCRYYEACGPGGCQHRLGPNSEDGCICSAACVGNHYYQARCWPDGEIWHCECLDNKDLDDGILLGLCDDTKPLECTEFGRLYNNCCNEFFRIQVPDEWHG